MNWRMMKKERASARARRDAHRGKGANAERTRHGRSHGLFVDVRTAFSRSGLLRHHGTGYPHGQATAAGPRRPARARRPDAEPRSWETEGGELPSGTWHPAGGCSRSWQEVTPTRLVLKASERTGVRPATGTQTPAPGAPPRGRRRGAHSALQTWLCRVPRLSKSPPRWDAQGSPGGEGT